jgi:hypothetical protein
VKAIDSSGSSRRSQTSDVLARSLPPSRTIRIVFPKSISISRIPQEFPVQSISVCRHKGDGVPVIGTTESGEVVEHSGVGGIHRPIISALAALFLFAPGLVLGADPANQPQTSTAAQIEDLRKQLKKAQDDINALSADLYKHLGESKNETVLFDPAAQGSYFGVTSIIGPLLVVFDSVDPYLNGFTVHFRIGNPHVATISGYTITAEWNYKYPDGLVAPLEAFTKWYADRKVRTFTPNVPLRPGAWTPLSINLPDTTVQNIQSLSVRVSVTAVEFGRP